MVAAARFTRPPGSAAVCRGTSLLWTVLLLIGASQVAAKPINNETNVYMSYATPFMRAANYMIATAPLSEAQTAQVLPQNDALADANFVLDDIRFETKYLKLKKCNMH